MNLAIGQDFAGVSADQMPQEQKHIIDPEFPISSLCGAGQQFTVLRDNDHGSPLIPLIVAYELPNAAQNCGVKHLILEYGLSSDDDDKEFNETLLRINGIGPKISAQELMEKSYLFKNSSSGTPEQINQSGEAYATMMVMAMNEGIKVHLIGDYPGVGHFFDAENYLYQEMKVSSEKEEFINKNPELYKQYETYISITDPAQFDEYMATLTQSGMTDEDIDRHMSKMMEYADKINEYDKQVFELIVKAEESQKLFIEARFSDEALEARAERFIAAANGENALILWGGAHFDNSMNPKDIDEYLDKKLAEKAIEEGHGQQPFVTKQIDLYPTREAYDDNVQNGLTGPDPAVFTYIISEGELEIPPSYQEQFNLEPSISPSLDQNDVGLKPVNKPGF